ncbi:MAG: hypothetical protein V4525_08435 [Pseudomonadota bacterium]
MLFFEKEYLVYVVLSGPYTKKPWSWPLWQEIQKLLEPFALISRGKAAIRSTQVLGNNGKKISFGKIGWDEKSHAKWTHDSPVTETSSKNWCFLNVEAWAPSWTVCAKENSAPDFYLSVNNEHPYGESDKSQFGAIVIVALATSTGSERLMQFTAAVTKIAAKLNSPLVVYKHRNWGTSIGSSGFTNALNDLGVTGLFKAGARHQRPLDVSTFSQQWMLMKTVHT